MGDRSRVSRCGVVSEGLPFNTMLVTWSGSTKGWPSTRSTGPSARRFPIPMADMTLVTEFSRWRRSADGPGTLRWTSPRPPRMRPGLAIEVSSETWATTAPDIECVRSGRTEHLHDTYAWDNAAGEWVTAQRLFSLIKDNERIVLLENAIVREQEPSGVCMGLFRTFASKMPLVQAQLDNPNRPAVPAQFGQPFGQDLDKLQKRPETMSLTSSFMVGVRRFELLTSSVSGKRSPPELNARSVARYVGSQRREYLSKEGALRATLNLVFFTGMWERPPWRPCRVPTCERCAQGHSRAHRRSPWPLPPRRPSTPPARTATRRCCGRARLRRAARRGCRARRCARR